jgi:hypothetical protein
MYYYSIQFLFLYFSLFFCHLSIVFGRNENLLRFFLCVVICISTVYYIIKTHAQKGRQRRDGEEMMEKMWKRRRLVLYECKKAKGLLLYVLTYVWIFFELSGQTQFS